MEDHEVRRIDVDHRTGGVRVEAVAEHHPALGPITGVGDRRDGGGHSHVAAFVGVGIVELVEVAPDVAAAAVQRVGRIDGAVGTILRGEDVVAVAGPGDHEVASRVHADVGIVLVAAGGGVHLEFGAEGVAVGVEALCVDVPVAAFAAALPNDREVPAAVDGHAGEHLVAGRCRVDLELRSDPVPRDIESLAVDAPAVAVLALTRPDDDKAAAGVHRRRAIHSVAGRGRVHHELVAAGGAVGVVHFAQISAVPFAPFRSVQVTTKLPSAFMATAAYI